MSNANDKLVASLSTITRKPRRHATEAFGSPIKSDEEMTRDQATRAARFRRATSSPSTKPAQKTLKNGATEIARISIDDVTVVMANTGGYQPFVTWRMDDDGNCYWGHYFATHDEAVADMLDRV